VINQYLKGKYLGKGGFAKCYEFINLANNKKYAAKIIEKATLTRSKAKEKVNTL
jgi:polo-like kinase 1